MKIFLGMNSSCKKSADNQILFSKDMKLVELIDADYRLLSVLVRLNIRLPFGDVSIEQICQQYGISVDMFLTICKVCSMADYEPEIHDFTERDLKLLLQYLQSSHSYYLTTLLPAVERGVEQVLEGCSVRQSEILRKFYGDYAEEVRRHLAYEDMHLFPYVENLGISECVTTKQMEDFMAEHDDICDKVDDIKSIIIKYLPEQCSTNERCQLLFDLFAMRDDLAKHTAIEQKILAPMVKALERRLGHE